MKSKMLVIPMLCAVLAFSGCLPSEPAPSEAASSEAASSEMASSEMASSEAAPSETTEGETVLQPDAKIIKISNGVNEQHPAYIGCKEFERLLEEKTDGRYDVQVYANAQLGDDKQSTQDVSMGNLEMVVTSASPITGIAPEFMVFDLPFIVPNEKAADAIFDGPVGEEIANTLDGTGLHLLTYYENGFRQLTNSVHEVRTPEDVKGLKIRTMQNPVHLELWTQLGAVPTPMAFSEIFTALQQHTIDGQENPIPTIALQKYYEVQDYCTLTSHVYGPHVMLIGEELWNTLSEEDKVIFEECALASAKVNRQTNRDMNVELVQELKDNGMTVTELTPEELELFKVASEPVYAKFEEEIGKELIDKFVAAAEAAK